MEKIKSLLRFLRLKLILEKSLKYIFYGFIFDLIISLFLIFLSKHIFIYNLTAKIFLLFTFTLISALFYYFVCKRPSYSDAARIADSLGFKERFTTAFDLHSKNKNKIYFDLILRDIVKSSDKFNFSKNYKIKLPYKHIAISVCLTLICIIIWLIPFEKREEFAEVNSIKDYINIQRDTLKENKKEIMRNQDINNKYTKSVNKELKKLDGKLGKADSIEEAVDTIQKTQYKLKEIDKNSDGEISEKVEKLNQSMADVTDILQQNTDKPSHFAESENENDNKNNYENSQNTDNDKDVMPDNNLKPNDKDGNGVANIDGSSNQEYDNNENERIENDYNVKEKDVSLNGVQTDSGKIYQSKQKMNAEKGEIVDYKEVYSQYKNEAMRSLNDSNVPDSMKDIVKNYFSALD